MASEIFGKIILITVAYTSESSFSLEAFNILQVIFPPGSFVWEEVNALATACMVGNIKTAAAMSELH